MTAMKPLINNILCLKKIPVLLEKSYEKESIVMGHHPYKEIQMPFVGGKIGHIDATGQF